MSDLPCNEIVELVTAFLDRALDAETERRFVDHLALCTGCERYLNQFRQTIGIMGNLPADTAEGLPAEVRDALRDAFRDPRP